MANAGVLFLTLSGGEIMMRRDFFEILEYARRLMFCVKLKTNGVMIRDEEARRIADLAVDSVQISIYSHKPEVHDAITKLPGSLRRSVDGARRLVARGVKVFFANVLMKDNATDYKGVQAMAAEAGAHFVIDPTITPMMDGGRDVLDLNIDHDLLRTVFRDRSLLPDTDQVCAPPKGPFEQVEASETMPCSAGHTACYVSPYGELFPCVQFPLTCGNVRTRTFEDIWYRSPEMLDVRSIRMSEVQGCSSCVHGSTCSRCPGLAYTEGNMRGPSIQDCEKSFARTGVPSVNLQKKKSALAGLVQIELLAV